MKSEDIDHGKLVTLLTAATYRISVEAGSEIAEYDIGMMAVSMAPTNRFGGGAEGVALSKEPGSGLIVAADCSCTQCPTKLHIMVDKISAGSICPTA